MMFKDVVDELIVEVWGRCGDNEVWVNGSTPPFGPSSCFFLSDLMGACMLG